MTKTHPPNDNAAERYAHAYSTHHTDRDLLGALRAYVLITEVHPSAAEAGYARSQIQNIVSVVVPAEEVLSSATALAFGYLERARAEPVAGAAP